MFAAELVALFISLFLLFFLKNSNGTPVKKEMVDRETEQLNKRILTSLDLDKDGQLTFDEYLRGYKAGTRCGMLPYFTKTDIDGDKQLSFAEIAAPKIDCHLIAAFAEIASPKVDFFPKPIMWTSTSGCSRRDLALNRTEIQTLIGYTDQNQDGQLSFPEISDLVIGLYKNNELMTFMLLIDTNGDLKLQLHELNAYPAKIKMDKKSLRQFADFMTKRC